MKFFGAFLSLRFLFLTALVISGGTLYFPVSAQSILSSKGLVSVKKSDTLIKNHLRLKKTLPVPGSINKMRPGFSRKADSLPFINQIPDFITQPVGQNIQTVDAPIGNIHEYLAYIPAGYNKSPTKLWPLIIFLHGLGEIGHDINRVKYHGLPKELDQEKNLNFIVISPQCSSGGWWSTPVLEKFLTQILLKYNCNPKQIYLTGLSMGGIETWAWAIQDPEVFAAIIPVSATGNPVNVSVLKETPVWAFHGDQDPVVPYAGDKAMVDALKKAGGNVRLSTIKGKHDIWSKVYTDKSIYSWLLQFRLP